METCQAITPPFTHDGEVSHASFSADGKRVVTASYDKSARVWDVETCQALTPPLKHGGAVRYASFSPDGKWVITISAADATRGAYQTARVWDVATGQEVNMVTSSKD